MNYQYLWVIEHCDLKTGECVPYLHTFGTKKEAQQNARDRNKCNKIPDSSCYNKKFIAVKYIAVT
jgi:hypothetical protein